MKKSFNITALLYNSIVCAVLLVALLPIIGEAAFVVVGLMFAYGFVPGRTISGVLREEVISRIFSADLQEALYPANEFYTGAQVDAGITIDQEIIEVPQDEDGDAQTVVNPTQFPLQTVVEEDKKKSYGADLLATKPLMVTDLNQAMVSYDKRAAKLRKHINSLNDQIAFRILYGWMPTVNTFIKQTTGATNRTATAPGATGNRKMTTKEDILAIFTLFNKLNIPMAGRRALFTPEMYEDLLTISSFVDADKLGKMGAVPEGVLGRIFGFDIFVRSVAPVFTESATPTKKAPGAAPATTDNLAALFFHPSFVRYGKGAAKVYVNPDRGEYLGGTMNAAVRGGSMISRLSERGVAALVQDNA